MYRVLLPAVVSLTLAFSVTGCSLGSSSLSSGLASNDRPTSSLQKRSGALGAEPSTRTASADTARAAKPDDKIPKGTFEKAPSGALSDRDYGTTNLDADKARELINAYRKEKGLKPLKLNTSLTEAAKNHSRDLAKWDRISHYGSDGSNPWDRVKRTGYNAKLAAENVGTGQVTIDEVMKGWKESPGHNKNLLLADADHMGIALVQDPKTEFKTFWTLIVGSSL
jgi:uncharacterized protein YkwD